MGDFTADEIKTLRQFTKLVRDLNAAVQDVDKSGYIVELRLLKAKPGYPQVRFQLARRIGTD